MAKGKKINGLMSLVVALGLIGCGGEDDGFNNFNNPNLNLGFRVLLSDPEFGASSVPLDQVVRVRMSEPIDPSSIEGSVQVLETIGSNAPTDITYSGTISSQGSSTDLAFIPGRSYVLDARYQIILKPTLRSMSGKSIVAQTIVSFSTGVGGSTGTGLITKPGAPYVTDLRVSIQPGHCLGFMATFSEDLGGPPSAFVESKILFGLLNVNQLPIGARPLYTNSRRTWILELPNGGCYEELMVSGAKVKLRIVEAFDLQNEYMSSPKEKDFTNVSGFWF